MPLTNTVRDKPTTLDLDGFRGNPLIARLTVAGSAPMPTTVTAWGMASASGRALASGLQPTITRLGRTITIAYPASTLYPSVGWHQIAFDGRNVLAGSLSFNYGTTSSPTIQDLSVRIDGSVPVGVTILVGESAGGSGSELSPIGLAVTSNDQTVWDLGLNQSRRTLWVNGVRYFEGDDYTISLPLLTWQGGFPIKTGFNLKLT